MSSFLFILSNIFVPFTIIIYKTAIRARTQGENGTGQWLCLILFSFFSNFLYYIASDSNLFLFGDLAIKLGICFMPPNINSIIEKKISHLHLQIMFQIIRGHLIEYFYVFHSFITAFALSKMDDTEKQHFKEALVSQLKKQDHLNATQESFDTKLSAKLKAAHKHYDNYGVTCDILTPQMLQKQQKDRDKLRRILSGEKRGPKPTGHLSPPKDESSQKSIVEASDGDSGMRKKNSILMQRSSTDLGIIEENDEMIKKGASMIKKKGEGEKKKVEVSVPAKAIKKQKKASLSEHKQPTVSFQEQPSEILNKLDVSDYSDMFEDEDEFEEEKSLVTKVQAIVEIGTGASIRLQIYNIQLYSNDEIRIMSLYGREFEKHKLLGIIPQKHGYYELKLQGGKVNKRKVKFRGKIDSFAKFVQSGQN